MLFVLVGVVCVVVWWVVVWFVCVVVGRLIVIMKFRCVCLVLVIVLVLVVGVILVMCIVDVVVCMIVVVYFDNSNGVFVGDDVFIWGVLVGKIVKIEL